MEFQRRLDHKKGELVEMLQTELQEVYLKLASYQSLESLHKELEENF